MVSLPGSPLRAFISISALCASAGPSGGDIFVKIFDFTMHDGFLELWEKYLLRITFGAPVG
jgi:hypothetical protein